MVTFLALKLTVTFNSYLIKKYSFAGFRPKQKTFAKTPEPAVKPEIVEAIPEPVQEPEVTEATPKKTSWSSQSPQKPESTSSPKSQLFGSTSLRPKNSFVGKCFICELSVSHRGQLRQHISTVHGISEPLDKYLDLPPLKIILNINDPDSSIEIHDNLDSLIKLSKHPAKPGTTEKKKTPEPAVEQIVEATSQFNGEFDLNFLKFDLFFLSFLSDYVT